MAIARFGRQVKRSYQSFGFCVKLTAVVILGLCFVVTWSVFSPSSYSVASQRETFDDIAEPISGNGKKFNGAEFGVHPKKEEPVKREKKKEGEERLKAESGENEEKKEKNELKLDDGGGKGKGEEKGEGLELEVPKEVGEEKKKDDDHGLEGEDSKKEEDEENGGDVDQGEGFEEKGNEEVDMVSDDGLDQEPQEKVDDNGGSKKSKKLGPLFDPKPHYTWQLCNTRSKHNYIPCIDIESASRKVQSYRHHERSCPKAHQLCLVPLPPDGYETPVSWPESMSKILYKNLAHPKLAEFVKTQNWVVESGEYLTFPQSQSALKGGIRHYLDSIEEMVPDIMWGKNIRVVLDIGCKDSSFVASLVEKDVLALTLGLKDDLVDLAQVALERGFPAVVSPFATRRLPFPSGVFDAIHCGECHISWHSNGGKLLLEMNRVMRPGGYFILSTTHNSVEAEEGMSTLTASICWNILADKTDEESDIGIKVYQKPEANDIYELRRKKVPPLCNAKENPDFAWNAPIKVCLHQIPSAIEERGTEWPEEWPKRLETFPDWMNNREKLIADDAHWKAIVDKSYLVGLGIDWSKIRNAMDMKAINGGFAAALAQQKVWVMNVVPVHAPNTLPIIFERGLVGIYHDWCESFGTYPRSYDLLHADHLFSRLKNRCKQPVVIVVEMDRILRPGGWVIIRDKVEILDPLERILRSLNWEIRLTFAQNKEGILCAQKTSWRP
nr:probable methyltransferase PMT28 [Ipomoea batatas]